MPSTRMLFPVSNPGKSIRQMLVGICEVLGHDSQCHERCGDEQDIMAARSGVTTLEIGARGLETYQIILRMHHSF